MINIEEFTIKRNIEEELKFLETHEHMVTKVFTAGFAAVLKNFDFAFTKKQDLETQSRYIAVEKDSDWFLDDQERSINCFFPEIHTEEIFLSLIFKDQQYQVPLEKNCIYFLPSWISYKFINKTEKLQSIYHFWFFSDTKIKNKETNVWW